MKVAAEEKEVFTLKFFAYGLKKGTHKFILNSTLDTLPTKSNLLKCKKSSLDKGNVCRAKETPFHVLSGCPVSVRQGRLTCRYNRIVKYIASILITTKYKVFSDIKEFQTNAMGTIPSNILITTVKSDIVIINEENKEVNIFELTVQLTDISASIIQNFGYLLTFIASLTLFLIFCLEICFFS